MITRLILPLFACMVLLSHCKPSEQKVSSAEAEQFAKDMELAATRHRADFITSNLLVQALSDRISKIKEVKYKNEIESGLTKGLKNSGFEKSIFEIMGKQGSFEKVKRYEKNEMQRVIFRAQGDGGFNYFDVELTKLKDKVGIADILIYTSGENISKSMAEIVDKLMGESDASADAAGERLQAVKRLMQKENYKAAKKEMDELPPAIRNTRVAAVLNVQIASNLDDSVYMREIALFQQKYAAEPGIQITMIDLYILRKEYENAMNAINQVDSVINKDPFLDYYRGLISYIKGEKEAALNYYLKVTASKPAFPGAYTELVSLYVDKDDKKNAQLYFSKYKALRNADEQVISTYEQAYPFLKD